MEVPDLSKLNEETKARLAAMAEAQYQEQERAKQEEPPKGHQALTAFLVIINHDGHAWTHPDVNFPLVLQRMPTPNEVYGAAAQVQKDVLAAETAQRTMHLLDQRAKIAAQQMQQQAEAQRQAAEAEAIRSQLGDLRRGDPRKR